MAISPLALKLIGAGAVAVPAVSIGVVYRENITNFFKNEKKEEVNPDQELIKILEKDNQDIIFEVKKGGDQELDNLTFSGTTEPKTITVSSKISTTNTNNIKGAKIEDLKNLNKGDDGAGKDWTWECKIKLEIEGESTNATTLYNEGKLKGSSGNEGLFEILKKDLNNETDKKEKYKNVKIQFIKNCASIEPSKKITSDTLSREQIFKLKKGSTSDKVGWTSTDQEESKLYFKDTKLFNKWFAAPLKLTKWDLHLIKLAKGDGIKFTVVSTPTDESKLFDFSSEPQKQEMSYTVQSSDNDSKLNSSNPWTWKCIVNFSKANGTKSNLKQKSKLIEFFNKLKSEANKEKDLKAKFIESCSTFRNSETTALSSGTISAEKTFSLKDENENLTFEHTEELEYLFGITAN